MTQGVKVTRHYDIQFDGHIDDYVWTADQYSQAMGWGQLDSYDAGDATGLWVRAYEARDDLSEPLIHESARRNPTDGSTMCLITVTADDDLFIWNPPLEGN